MTPLARWWLQTLLEKQLPAISKDPKQNCFKTLQIPAANVGLGFPKHGTVFYALVEFRVSHTFRERELGLASRTLSFRVSSVAYRHRNEFGFQERLPETCFR